MLYSKHQMLPKRIYLMELLLQLLHNIQLHLSYIHNSMKYLCLFELARHIVTSGACSRQNLFEAILSGDADSMPEAAFYNVGTLDDAYAKSKQL